MLTSALSFGQSVNVPLNYWGYEFLDRLEAKGGFSSFDLRARPVPRQTITDIIAEIDRKAQKSPKLLAPAEQALFDQLKGDFIEELQNREGVKFPAKEENHLVTWGNSARRPYVDLYGRQTIRSSRGQQFGSWQLRSETVAGGILRGQVQGKIGFYLDARNRTVRDKNDPARLTSSGLFLFLPSEQTFHKQAIGYLVYEKPWLRLELGRDETSWGPGYRGALAISQNLPPSDMVRLGVRFSRFRFTSMHALLKSAVGAKYLAAHRLDVMLLPGLYLGASESVVYGKRDIELSYINPLMPYHIAEHHLGDLDNNALSFDLTSTVITGVKLYGEFFIDDMTSTKSLTKYFGNKFAFLLGGLWAEPFHVDNLDMRFEYTRIEPYVYSHHDSINVYTSDDKIIGHWLGPNSDAAYLQAGYQLGRDVRIELSLERLRKGVGAADTHSRPESGTVKHFLSGTVEQQKRIGLVINDQIRRDVFCQLSYVYQDIQNLALFAGRFSHDQLVAFELYFNY
jgi:hypothetical protein